MSLNANIMQTVAGQKVILTALKATLGPLLAANTKVSLLQAINVATDGRSYSGEISGTDGLDDSPAVTAWAAPVVSESGKVYMHSNMMTFTLTAPTGPQTIIGAFVTNEDTLTANFAYHSFETPVTVDENGETINVILEVGFDGNELYFYPRLVPLGA